MNQQGTFKSCQIVSYCSVCSIERFEKNPRRIYLYSPRPRPKRSEVPIRIPSIPHLLIPSPLTPTPQTLCEPINEPQGVAVKFRKIFSGFGLSSTGPPPPSPPLPRPSPAFRPLVGAVTLSIFFVYIYICIYIYIYIYMYIYIYYIYIYTYTYIYIVIYSLSMHKPYHSSPRRRCTPISCESKSPRPGIMSSSQHTAGPRRTTRSV